MSYKVKQKVTMLVVGIIILGLYARQIIVSYSLDGMKAFEMTNYWAKTMLIYMGVGVGAVIVTLIVFNIIIAVSTAVKKTMSGMDEDSIEQEIKDAFDGESDEMDRLIDLKAAKVNVIFISIAFVVGLITLLFEVPVGVMLNTMFLSFLIGSIVEGCVQIYLYKRGVSHG